MKTCYFIAGEDRTKDILFTQGNRPSVERQLMQEDDCRFVVKSGKRPVEGEEIIILLGLSIKLFAGIIDEVHDMELGQGIHILYSCKARDYTYQLNRKLVVETYENQSADVIVRDILTKYAPNFNDAFVESGAPVVEWITFDYKMPSECFQELCDYVGWYWYVDYDKAVHFFNPQELPEPAPMIIQPGGDFRNFRRSIDIVGLRNRVYVRGGSMLSDFQPVRWKADGVARIWTLPWPPHEISFKVGEVPKTVGVENLHEESAYDYMMSFSEKYIRCSSHTSTPVEGITMELTAKQDIPVITMVEDYASQAAVKAVQGGDGIYEHVIVDDTLTSIVAAEAAGMADLREHANPRVKGSFETEYTKPPELAPTALDYTESGEDFATGVLDGVVAGEDGLELEEDALSGSRISLPLDLSSVGTVKTSEISWQATEPTDTSLKVETSLSTDSGETWGAWQQATNGGSVPGIIANTDLSTAKLKTRVTLETEDTSVTSALNNLTINLIGEKLEPRIWQPGQIVEINLPGRGIQGEYLIQRVTTSPLTSKLWTFRVEFGGRLLGIADFLQALVSAQQKRRHIEPTKNVQKYIYGEETLELSDELTAATRALPFICGDSDAICGMVVVSDG